MTYKRLAAMALALLCLTSCAAMLDREATYTSPHVENPPASLADAYRINTYSGLRSALQSYVEEGMETGNLRFPATYPGNLTVDLEKAKRQLMEEDALGCYAVEDVSFHINRIIAYYEVTADFTYKVPPAEYMALENVEDDSGLDRRMEEALERFGGQLTFLLDRRGLSDTALTDSVERIFDLRPELAVGAPTVEVTYYPETGDLAVAEVELRYAESATALRLRQRNVLRAAESLAAELAGLSQEDARAALMGRWQLEPEGSSLAAGPLLDGAGSEKGLERAAALVCRALEEQREEEGP